MNKIDIEDIKLILESKSPVRKRMLEKENIPFEIIVSDADETPDLSKTFEEQLKDISMRKAQIVFEATIDRGERIIAAADQNIVFDNIMYGKPKSLKEARELIKNMAGSDKVYAYTGNAIIYANKDRIIKLINNCDISRMSMDNISDETIEEYITNNEPLTKCGGISISDADFLHLEDGKLSTACGMTIEDINKMFEYAKQRKDELEG